MLCTVQRTAALSVIQQKGPRMISFDCIGPCCRWRGGACGLVSRGGSRALVGLRRAQRQPMRPEKVPGTIFAIASGLLASGRQACLPGRASCPRIEASRRGSQACNVRTLSPAVVAPGRLPGRFSAMRLRVWSPIAASLRHCINAGLTLRFPHEFTPAPALVRGRRRARFAGG